MSRHNKARRSRSPSPQYDEESDYQIALRLSEELNGGQLPLSSAGKSSPNPMYDADSDFEYALQLQFEDHNGAYGGKGKVSTSQFESTGPGDAAQAEVSPWALNGDEVSVAIYQPETPGGKSFTTLYDFMRHVKAAQCSKCGNYLFKSELEVSMMLQSWRCGNTALTSSLKCSRCLTTSCIACTPQPYAKQSMISVQGKRVSWCCAGGRLLLLWLLLCDLDEHFAVVKAKEAKKSESKHQQHKSGKANKQARGGGVGFGGPSRYAPPAVGAMPSGLGFGSDDMEEYTDDDGSGTGVTLTVHRFGTDASNSDAKAKVLSAQHEEDIINALHLELVEGLLPSFERESCLDFDPPEAVADILLQSKILHYCTELLRNDSLEDATKRKGVYQALINLLRTLGAHFTTARRTIYDERPSRQDKVSLLDLCWRGYTKVPKDKTSSLFSCLGNISTQSALVIQGAKTKETEFQSHDGQNLLLLCRQISELQAYLAANAMTIDTKPKDSAPEIPALTDVPDHVIMASHKFSPSAKALTSAPKGRFKRLITEITTLKTGLPPGIFVRYCESRPDVQKVLIVGPEGTPYENGLFEFDVYCDANFPNRPPMVDFKTTGGGRVGFNPNLYATGKVCLSLLGTWQGEPWVPNESTLLQIVISIQAMILCEEPWYNEPGREMSYARGRTFGPAESYNQAIREHTLRTAILEWLNKTPPLWKDVIHHHFKTNANTILKTAVKWSDNKTDPNAYGAFHAEHASEDVYPNAPSSIKSMLPQLQESLQKYGVEKIVPDHLELVAEGSESARSRRYQSPYPPGIPPHPLPSLPLSSYGPVSIHVTPNPFTTLPALGPPPGFLGPPSNFSGQNGVLEGAPAEAPSTVSGGRGGTGRYETRSFTRGRGEPSVTTSPRGFGTFSPGGYGRGRGGAIETASPTNSPYSSVRGGRGGSTVQPHPGGFNLWPPVPSVRGGRGGSRGGGRGHTPDDRRRGGRGGQGGQGAFT